MDLEIFTKKYFDELWKYTLRNPNKIFYIFCDENERIEYVPENYKFTSKKAHENFIKIAESIALKQNSRDQNSYNAHILKLMDNIKKVIKTYYNNSLDVINLGNLITPNHYYDLEYEEQKKQINNMNNDIIYHLLLSASKEEKEYIINNIYSCLINSNGDKLNNELILMKYLKDKGLEDIAMKLWNKISVKKGFIQHNQYISLINNFFGEENSHPYILYFMSKRAGQVKRNSRYALEVRNTLLNHYGKDEEKLKDYIPYFPMIKKYLEELHQPTSFFVQGDDIVIETVDLEKFKAAVPINLNELQYQANLEVFCRMYTKKDKRIKKISTNLFKPKTGFNHFLIYISTIEVPGMEKYSNKVIQEKINGFANMLKENQDGQMFSQEYMAKWYDMNELNNAIPKKEGVSKKIKI